MLFQHGCQRLAGYGSMLGRRGHLGPNLYAWLSVSQGLDFFLGPGFCLYPKVT